MKIKIKNLSYYINVISKSYENKYYFKNINIETF